VTVFDRCCNAYAQGVAVQSDGKIVAAGGGAGYFALSRYTPDGRLDASFGRSGKLRTRFRGR
jgi:sugar lactone lactonase YvrE